MARIIPLSEGSFTVDTTKRFIPFDPARDDLRQRNRGSLLVEVQPFLLITQKDYILLDTGLGFLTQQGNLQLHQNLINQGIDPSAITKVLMSHLHKDHSGGIAMQEAGTGERTLSFPGAAYYVNEKELAYAMEEDGNSYAADEFRLLQGAGQVILTGDEGDIEENIHYQVTGGHSPCHQVFWIKEAGEIYFFGGDVAPQLSQMKSRFIAKYDYDGRKSMELRRGYLETGRREGWTFLFYHDINTPFIRFGP